MIDVLVIGGGNAGLTAAITAAESGCKTVVLEASDSINRGGNTRYVRNVRYLHEVPDRFTDGIYSKQEFLKDLFSVSGSNIDESMANLVIEESRHVPEWMEKHGVIFKKSIKGTINLSRTNAFYLGGGKSLINTYHRRLEKLNVRIMYNCEVNELYFSGNKFDEVLFSGPRGAERLKAKALIVASGGFEANLEWLHEFWGSAVDNFIVRGSKNNKGYPLKSLIRNGARTAGLPKGAHMIAVDARSPKFDGGIVTRVDSVPIGIVVNSKGERFYDEGEDMWPKRYAIWGRLIADQQDQMAFSILDSEMLDYFIPPAFGPIRADTLEELADMLGIDQAGLSNTIKEFNTSLNNGHFDFSMLDSCSTINLTPPKSHWALPVVHPPFYGYPLRPGITFTYLGVKIDQSTRIQNESGYFENAFAAGEIASGNILRSGYLGGFGIAIGSTLGMIAGREAANYARH